MRPYLFLLLCLFTFSCQQRYGHVKKVKVEPVDVGKAEIPSDNTPIVSQETSVPDPAGTVTLPRQEVPSIQAQEIAGEGVEKSVPFPKQSYSDNIRQQVKEPPEQMRSVVRDYPDETPPHERNLMVAIFLFWTLLFTLVISLVAAVLLVLIVFDAVFFTLAFEAVLLVIFIVLLALIAGMVLGFYIGRNRILERLGYLPPEKELKRYYFIALGIVIIGNFFLGVILPGISGLLLFIAAGIYIMAWDPE